MYIKILIFLTCIAASSQSWFFGKDSLFHKAAEKAGITNLINVEGDARAKFGKNEVDMDGAFGIGESGVGAHGSARADVLGQKARIRADILDGHKIDQHNHEVYVDNQNRQYILEREYIGSNYVLVRKYLEEGQVYLAQQQREGYNQQYVQEQYVPQRQYGYVKPGQYGSENYQQRNYDHHPGSHGQQSGRYGQQYGQYDQQSSRFNQQFGGYGQQSGQYDEQYGRYDEQSGQPNQQTRRYNEQSYDPQSGTYQQPGHSAPYDQRTYSPQSGRDQYSGQDQHNHQEVYLDNQNRQYMLQKEYVGNKLVQVRKYLDNGQKYVVGGNVEKDESPRQQSTTERDSHLHRVVEAVNKNVENYRHNFESGVQSVVNKVEDVTGYKPNLGVDEPEIHGNRPNSTTDSGSKFQDVIKTIDKNVENYRHNFESGVQTAVNKIGDVTGYKPKSNPTYQGPSTTPKISGQNVQTSQVNSDENVPFINNLSKVEHQINGENSVNDNVSQTTESVDENTYSSDYYDYKTIDATEKSEIQKVNENDIHNFVPGTQKVAESEKQKVENDTEEPEQ